MAHSRHAEFARVAAVCVNLAIDGIEGDIRKELDATSGEVADALVRLLDRLKKRRIVVDQIEVAGTA
jgi:hypothetical protein